MKWIVWLLLSTIVGPLFVLPAQASATTLTFSPSSRTVTVGDDVSVRLVLNAGEAVNAVEATIHFSNDVLDAKSISKNGSVLTLWAQGPTISHSAGTVTFSGGKPSPGITGNGKTVLTVMFSAEHTGTATLSLTGASALANDGEGTDVLSGTGSATITVERQETPPSVPETPSMPSTPTPTITSTSHPDANAWYTTGDPTASWRGGSGVTGYGVVFDQNAGTVPPQSSDGTGTTFSRAGLEDGVWFLHVRAQYDAGWSGTATYVFRIDRVGPVPFTVNVDHAKTIDRMATASFATEDTTSGIDRYELRLDDAAFAVSTSPYALTDLTPGSHTVTVRAIDKAGNTTEAGASFTVTAPEAPTADLFFPKPWKTPGQGFAHTVISGEALRLRGLAKLGSIVRIRVHSTEESVFEFPVETIIDPNPVQPAPSGYGVWKVDIQPNLGPGEHEIRVTTVDGNGVESVEAPVIKFRVVNNIVRVGSYLIPTQFAFTVLALATGAMLLLVVLLLLFIRDVKKQTGLVGDVPSKRPSFWKYVFSRFRRK